MTELRDPKPPEFKPAGPSNGSGDGAEALHNLYRMSRTAGLGSGDYVAINNTSIIALLLGLVSVFALIYPLALIVAAAAILCGILALAQIRSSNGTQTGRSFAIVGILAALALGGAAGGKIFFKYLEDRNDEKAITKVIKQLSDLVVAKQYPQAYQTLFSENFRTEFTQEKFSGTWESFVPQLGQVQYVDWGNRAAFDVIKGTETKRGSIVSVVKFEKYAEPARQGVTLIKRDGEWVIDDFQQLFPRQKAQPGSPAGPEEPDGRTPQGPGLFGPPAGASGGGFGPG